MNWKLSSLRKRAFFQLLEKITGSDSPPFSVVDPILFQPTKYPIGSWNTPPAFRDVQFKSTDNTKLHGWYCPAQDPRGSLLLAHGNAGNITHRIPWITYLQSELQMNVFAFDYRGYGVAMEPYDRRPIGRCANCTLAAAKLSDSKESELILMGDSLGGAIIAQIAAESPPRAIILQSSFQSLKKIASHHFPYMSWSITEIRSIRSKQLEKSTVLY